MNEENYNSKNSNSRDKESQGEDMINLEGLDLSKNEWFQRTIRDLKDSMYENLLSRDDDLTYIRYLRWDMNHTPSNKDFNLISFFLKQISISFAYKKRSFYNFKHFHFPIHVSVHQKRKGYIINAHIDVKAHIDARYSKFTSKLLLDLSTFLKRMDISSNPTTRSVKYPERYGQEVIELEIPFDTASKRQSQTIKTKDNVINTQNGSSQAKIPIEQTYVEEIKESLDNLSQEELSTEQLHEETIADYQNEPVMYNEVNLNFFKTINIMQEIISEGYSLNEYIEQMALIKEFSTMSSVRLTSKKFLFLLTRVAEKHFKSSEFYTLIDNLALWNNEYSEHLSRTFPSYFKNRLLKIDLEKTNRAGCNYPIQNHIELRKELALFNQINSIKSIDLTDIGIEVLNDFLAIKIHEDMFRHVIIIISKAFLKSKERINSFLTLISLLINMLKGKKMKENAFIRIISIFFEIIPKKEEAVYFLYEIIKLLKEKKVIKLAKFIERYLLNGI